jgi:hypothetical protein
MNQYGRRTQRYWQQNLPTQYAQIPNPETFFAQLGETMAEQIADLAEQIAGPDPAGEDYLSKLGRLNMARTTAETEVFRETLPQPESTQPGEETEAPQTG